ncbi:MAG: winged helix-turn-helix domain-containing protein, partial [Bacteroidetes bacterium]|nr:winged helix-turn-helix domain-containing protein [Bacteroidota bacterium]
SHNHILWSRMPSYKKSMLDELLERDKQIFEYWSHAAAYLPIKNFRYSLIRKKDYQKKYKEWCKANRKIISFVYDRIRAEGELQSKDFAHTGIRSSGWWDWKPAKEALDILFHQGHLMIARRKGFQKVYDLTERVLPGNIDTTFPSPDEFYRYLISTAINSHGIISEKEIVYLRKYDKKLFRKVINEYLESRKILKVNVEGFRDENYYTLENKIEISGRIKKLSQMHILSPFDNLVIQRKRLSNIFKYDYILECYVPHHKRKFGYFCLPVLFGDKFIGKIDAKADRKAKLFIVKNIFLEKKIKMSRSLMLSFEKQLIDFAKFTGCEKIAGYDPKNFSLPL